MKLEDASVAESLAHFFSVIVDVKRGTEIGNMIIRLQLYVSCSQKSTHTNPRASNV